MPFTAITFGIKLKDLRESFQNSHEEMASATGISIQRLIGFEQAGELPSGDEILIIADFFGCDFGWLVEDSATNPASNVRQLFRASGEQLSSRDRHAVQEFVRLCASDALLDELLEIRPQKAPFTFDLKKGSYKGQGRLCAEYVRDYYDLAPTAIVPDVFHWLRNQGVRVFRRALPSSSISGLFVDHPTAGRCILVNYSEDVYRQRFSAAHEYGHSLLDLDLPYNLSSSEDARSGEFREIRANTFASSFLIPKSFLKRWTAREWEDPQKLKNAADQLWVSIPALLSALKRDGIIDEAARDRARSQQLRLPQKRDPELSAGLSDQQQSRQKELLRMGLHRRYVEKCFEAHRRGLISWQKLSELLLVDPIQITEIAELFGVSFEND